MLLTEASVIMHLAAGLLDHEVLRVSSPPRRASESDPLSENLETQLEHIHARIRELQWMDAADDIDSLRRSESEGQPLTKANRPPAAEGLLSQETAPLLQQQDAITVKTVDVSAIIDGLMLAGATAGINEVGPGGHPTADTRQDAGQKPAAPKQHPVMVKDAAKLDAPEVIAEDASSRKMQTPVRPLDREEFRAILKPMKMSALKKKAEHAGIGQPEIEQAQDEDDARAAVIDLIVAAAGSETPVSVSASAVTDPVATAELALRTELSTMKVTQLVHRARETGASATTLEQAQDADDAKAALVDLIARRVSSASGAAAMSDPAATELALRTELSAMKVTQLIHRARETGASETTLEQAQDADDAKAALVDLNVRFVFLTDAEKQAVTSLQARVRGALTRTELENPNLVMKSKRSTMMSQAAVTGFSMLGTFVLVLGPMYTFGELYGSLEHGGNIQYLVKDPPLRHVDEQPH